MKRALFLLCGCLLTLCASAQNADQYKRNLSYPDPAYRSQVNVTEHGDAAEAIRSMLNTGIIAGKVRGYRISIFSDNIQNARSLATQAMARFKEIFPAIPAYLTYDNPYWKVTVGNCLTPDEATILCGRIRGTFPLAHPVWENIPISIFGQQHFDPAPPEATTTGGL